MLATLSEGQLKAISAIERGCSVLSLLGCLFTIITFCTSSAFHKPINRLVFYASFGNLMTNAGTLISRAYLGDVLSAGCQFQAFLIQMFMPADAYWTLAMAVNVYLTFYHKFDDAALRKMEIPYLLLCYGVPFIPALVFIFVKDSKGNRVYGNAVLWCWISTDWDIWRIVSFYGPVWIVIVVTFFIYIRAGRSIYEKRQQLRDFPCFYPGLKPVSSGDNINSYRSTKVTVTTEIVNNADASLWLAPLDPGSVSVQPDPPCDYRHGYLAHITTRSTVSAHSDETHTNEDNVLQAQNLEGNDNDAAGAAKKIVTQPRPVCSFMVQQQLPTRLLNFNRRNSHNVNSAAWSYTKCAILFFTAILITWIPSSANRVYSAIHKNEISIALEFMSAFVLPLQGFWNAVIYAFTSWSACKDLWHNIRCGRGLNATEPAGGKPPRMKIRHRRGNSYAISNQPHRPRHGK